MLTRNEIGEISKPEIRRAEITTEMDAFESYETKYHDVSGLDRYWDEENDYLSPEDFAKIFSFETQELEIIASQIDEYLSDKLEDIEDIEDVEIDAVFCEDDFIEIIKPYSEGAVIPAVVYWTSIKQAFVSLQAFENKESDFSRPVESSGHQNRVRSVTDLLIALNPITTIARFGYTFVTGKNPEPVLERLDKISEKIVDASDAITYLAANAGLGVVSVVENAIEYTGAGAEYLIGGKEKAEEILNLDFSDDLKAKLDALYGRDNWVSSIGNSVEKFGSTATYLALGMLMNAGGITAVAAGASLALGKAGEKTKRDIEKTGELTEKEMIHGLISGATLLAFAELGNIGAEKLGEDAPRIAKEIYKLTDGKINPKLLKSITNAVVNGLEAGMVFASYDIPEQISKEIERTFRIDPNEKGDWKALLGGTATSILTAATFTMVKELYVNKGFYSTYEERLNKTPKNNGEWTGDRGESTFILENEDVNALLQENGLDGISYTDAIPDFSEMSKGTVEIDNMTSLRRGKGNNFDQANIKLAEVKGCEPSDVARWMDSNGYVWHECNDMKTMQKIPFEINDKFGHLGGVGECKRRDSLLDDIMGRNDVDGGIFDE